jgi:hypothetical protein
MKNAWFMILGRRLNQLVRRMAIQWIVPLAWVDKLRVERTGLCCQPFMHEWERERVRQINWKLGIGSLISLTPAERAEQDRIAYEILDEILADTNEVL